MQPTQTLLTSPKTQQLIFKACLGLTEESEKAPLNVHHQISTVLALSPAGWKTLGLFRKCCQLDMCAAIEKQVRAIVLWSDFQRAAKGIFVTESLNT